MDHIIPVQTPPLLSKLIDMLFEDFVTKLKCYDNANEYNRYGMSIKTYADKYRNFFFACSNKRENPLMSTEVTKLTYENIYYVLSTYDFEGYDMKIYDKQRLKILELIEKYTLQNGNTVK